MPDCLQGPQIDVTGCKKVKTLGRTPVIERHDARRMALEVLEINPKAEIDQKTLEALLQVAAWQCVPPIGKLTRTGWVGLKNEGPIKAVKLKGMGLNKKDRITTPKKKPYYSVFYRVDFEEDGNPILPTELTDPYGGMSLATAKQEWAGTIEAQKHGVSALTPIALCQYPNMEWEDEPMALLMLGSPDKYDVRLGDLIQAPHVFDLKEQMEEGEEPIDFFMRAYKTIGENLRRIHHQQKMYSVQSHAGNFSYNVETKTAVFHDLEQLYKLDGNDNVNALRIANDIHNVIRTIVEYTPYFLYHSEDLDDIKDIIRMFLIGYFGKNSQREIYEFTAGLKDIDILKRRCPKVQTRTGSYKLLSRSERFRATKPSLPTHEARKVFTKVDEIMAARNDMLPSTKMLTDVRDGLVDLTR